MFNLLRGTIFRGVDLTDPTQDTRATLRAAVVLFVLAIVAACCVPAAATFPTLFAGAVVTLFGAEVFASWTQACASRLDPSSDTLRVTWPSAMLRKNGDGYACVGTGTALCDVVRDGVIWRRRLIEQASALNFPPGQDGVVEEFVQTADLDDLSLTVEFAVRDGVRVDKLGTALRCPSAHLTPGRVVVGDSHIRLVSS